MIDTAPVDAQAAAAIEAAEARAWTDVYSAAPEDWAAEVGLGFREVAGALVIQWAATGRRYFSRAIGLGVIEPARPIILPVVSVVPVGLAGCDCALARASGLRLTVFHLAPS